ncbi:MAG: hypothetical protein V3T22_10625 [Planctomycetota bacterium]
MIIPEWVPDENEYLRRQVNQLRLSIELLQYANEDLEERAMYWRDKREGGERDSCPPPSGSPPDGNTQPDGA